MRANRRVRGSIVYTVDAPLISMEAELIAIAGAVSGTRTLLASNEVRAGRAPDSEIQLHDPAAAWEHCWFRPQAGGHCVVDRDTVEGTFVNGRRVAQAVLAPGD